jgi:pimeloyl-ACP methyl ester carboxylesterase
MPAWNQLYFDPTQKKWNRFFVVGPSLRLFLLLLCVWLIAGCASQRYVKLRSSPINPLTESLGLVSRSGPNVTPRTKTLLRHYDLLDLYNSNPDDCLAKLQGLAIDEKGAEKIYAISELAYTIGTKAEKASHEGQALDMYTVAVSNAYMYLFCPDLDVSRNPYDPQFRGACELYNTALESTLRLVSKQGNLKPGNSYRIATSKKDYDVQVISRGAWHNADFESLKFCSDFQVKGLDSANVGYGVGVPMIAVRQPHQGAHEAEAYYPEGLSFPVTALLRVTSPTIKISQDSQHRHPCVLELHDPLDSTDIYLNSRLVPLQSDLSTPLAYFLDNPKFREQTDSNLGLIDPNKSEKLRGIYMLEPYDPNRIPVVMVHGLWSSPLTWMPMFNDLRSFQELRKNYQFWFYQYPTGQPFWVSATQMRSDLFELKKTLDPNSQHAVLDQMVLVGHSMGGLVSRMQTLESGEEFWRILSDEPYEKVHGEDKERQQLAAALFFHPNSAVKRVITIGTPHRGSDYANDFTRWLGRKVITLPRSVTDIGHSLIRQNPGLFRNTDLLTTTTSIDSLSPSSPIFPTMLRARRAPWVSYHNIIGVVSKSNWFGNNSSSSDGIVGVESAHMDDVASEIMVESKHQDIHRTARAILEVRRILVDHLRETANQPELAAILNVPKNLSRHATAPLYASESPLLFPSQEEQIRPAPIIGRTSAQSPNLSKRAPSTMAR